MDGRTGSNLRDEQGFTLIELMIAVIIIGILVGIAVPVYLDSRRNAQERTAEYNYMVGCQVVGHVWFKLVEQDENRYVDSLPPAPLRAPAQVDARYMSLLESRMRWSDIVVTGNHMRLGNNGVYQDGEIVVPVPGLERFNWENMYGTTGIVANAVWLDGRWQNNTNAVQNFEYLTVMTVAPSGSCRFTTYWQGVPIQNGTFLWEDGYGHPE